MQVKSLGLRTDLIFPTFEGQILDRGDYLVVRTPTNPTFYWGNFLLFARAPDPGDFDRWRELFIREIGTLPDTKHIAFTWDSADGEEGAVQPFVDAGFNLERNVVLAADAGELAVPARASGEVTIRPLQSEAEFQAVIEQQVLSRDEGHQESGYRIFRVFMMDRYRRMEQAGRGHWYGAFLDGHLVADLGIIHDGHRLGRYQSVETHPDFRHRGIAARMVYEAGRQAMQEHDLNRLVIIAESDTSAARVYGAAGFRTVERNTGLLWWEREPGAESQRAP